jgi:hypothetical protein
MIKLIDIVNDTYTNASGYQLYISIKPYFDENKAFELSFSGATPTSSSFLNSSFGELIAQYGLQKAKSLLKITHVTGGEAQMLKKFFSTFSQTAH